MLIEYYNTGKFGFSVVILKYLDLNNYSANFDENSKLYSNEVVVNEINGTILTKFSRSCDEIYLLFVLGLCVFWC